MPYAGIEAPIPLGGFGLNTDGALSDLPPGSLIEATNITLERGFVQKAPGALIWNTDDQLDSDVVAVHDWWPETYLQRMIAVTDTGNIYRDINDRTFNGATAITTGLGILTPNCQFVEGGNEVASANKKLFLFTDGRNQLKVLEGDGTSFADISGPAADWTTNNYPRVGVTHRNRLWAFQGQQYYASETDDHEDFTGMGLLTGAIFPGEGGDVIGARVYRGRLFAFKEGNFVHFLDDSDTNSDNWVWRKLTSNFGLAAPNSIVEALNDMLGGNSSGTVTSYQATETLGDVEPGDIFRAANVEQYIRANFSANGLGFMHALYYESKKQIFFTYRSTYKTTNDMLICLDMNREFPRITTWVKGAPQCLALRRDINGIPKPIYGGADGYVYIMDYEDRLEGSTAYEGAFRTAYTDFRYIQPKLASTQKHFDWLKMEFKEEGPHSVNVDVFIDGRFIETISVPMNAEGTYLDSFLLDTDRLAEATTQSLRYPLHGTGHRISFRVYNSGSNESFQIASIVVGIRPASQDSSKF